MNNTQTVAGKTRPAYNASLARWSRVLEIIIPIYMFGKSWGAAAPNNIALFRAQFPVFLVDACEVLKGLLKCNSEHMMKFISTNIGALLGFVIVLLLSVIIHFTLKDRKFIDSMRFTSVTLIPIAVLNGLLSHGVQTLVNNSQSLEILKIGALYAPWIYVVFNYVFYMIALWKMAERTGVRENKIKILLGIGTIFVAAYLLSGLLITPREWDNLLISGLLK